MALVVPDLEKAVQHYWNYFGIGPWHFYTYEKPFVKEMSLSRETGRPKLSACPGKLRANADRVDRGQKRRFTLCRFHQKAWLWRAAFGIVVEDINESFAEAEIGRLENLQDGSGFGADGDGHYAYLDTEDEIGVTLELIERPKRRRPPEKILSCRITKFMCALAIGNIQLKNDLILAPMDGYTDHPFRLIAAKLGSAMSYSEFINAIDVLHGHPFLEKRLTFSDEERPFVYQLLDNNPDRILQSAMNTSPRNPDAFDLNVGCSSHSVAGRGAGAGLFSYPEKIGQIIQSLSHNFDLPITAKDPPGPYR